MFNEIRSKMWNKHQNKEQQFTHLQLPNRLFRVLFFPSTLNDWFILDLNMRNLESILIFKSTLLSFIPAVQTDIYKIFLTQKDFNF